MKATVIRTFLVLQILQVCAFASNSVVNLSHYDLMRVDFERMKSEGVVGVIHEATYPRFDRDSYYGSRQVAATRAGLLWGAYHFGDATDPVRQADHFLGTVASQVDGGSSRPEGVLLVLDFEKNGHYPGGRCESIKPLGLLNGFDNGRGNTPAFTGARIGSEQS